MIHGTRAGNTVTEMQIYKKNLIFANAVPSLFLRFTCADILTLRRRLGIGERIAGDVADGRRVNQKSKPADNSTDKRWV